jgi:hypothetical protein
MAPGVVSYGKDRSVGIVRDDCGGEDGPGAEENEEEGEGAYTA